MNVGGELGGKDNDSLIRRTQCGRNNAFCVNLIFIYFIIMLEAKGRKTFFVFCGKIKLFLFHLQSSLIAAVDNRAAITKIRFCPFSLVCFSEDFKSPRSCHRVHSFFKSFLLIIEFFASPTLSFSLCSIFAFFIKC
jgi:hypothetical protein